MPKMGIALSSQNGNLKHQAVQKICTEKQLNIMHFIKTLFLKNKNNFRAAPVVDTYGTRMGHLAKKIKLCKTQKHRS